jgi:hypothetical protein
VSVLDKLSFTINSWIEYLLFGLGFTMTVVVAVQVFFRYVLNQSLFWSEELARYLLVWLSFLGASVAYRDNHRPPCISDPVCRHDHFRIPLRLFRQTANITCPISAQMDHIQHHSHQRLYFNGPRHQFCDAGIGGRTP